MSLKHLNVNVMNGILEKIKEKEFLIESCYLTWGYRERGTHTPVDLSNLKYFNDIGGLAKSRSSAPILVVKRMFRNESEYLILPYVITDHEPTSVPDFDDCDFTDTMLWLNDFMK